MSPNNFSNIWEKICGTPIEQILCWPSGCRLAHPVPRTSFSITAKTESKSEQEIPDCRRAVSEYGTGGSGPVMHDWIKPLIIDPFVIFAFFLHVEAETAFGILRCKREGMHDAVSGKAYQTTNDVCLPFIMDSCFHWILYAGTGRRR